MPDFSRDDRMPPMSQSSIPSASHAAAPRERRFSGPSDSGAKPARYPGVYQRPPPADYYRAPSPPPQSYRWPPAPPLDEPNYPPRSHSTYHRDSWDYRYRDANVGISAPAYPSNRTPPPFPEWAHNHPERGWSPGFGPEDTRYARREWDDRESNQGYSHGWDRPPSPGPPPPRDWQPGLYDRPSAGQPRGSPSLMHEPGWREPVSHYDRDIREEWIPPPDDWRNEDPYMAPPPEDPYINDPPPPNMPYGPPRARGRSFAQERRMPQPPPSGYHPPASQLSPRGPAHQPLDNPNRRHSQHDRRYSGGPGYSGDARGYVPHSGLRRSFQPGRGSFNDSHLQNRGAKIVQRDQLLMANPSIKVEENDGSLGATPGPASASSAHPEKGLAGKRSRTDSVAAEAEPASRRPSPFSSSVATANTTTDPAPATTRSTTVETQPQPTPAVTEPPRTQIVEPPAPAPVQVEPKGPDTAQEKRVYAESNNDSQPAPATVEAPNVIPQPDAPVEPASQAPPEETPNLAADATQKTADDETAMDVEPSASETGPTQPQPDIISADVSAEQAPDNSEPPVVPATDEHVDAPNDVRSDAGDNAGDEPVPSPPSPMPIDEPLNFKFAEPVDAGDMPIRSLRDFIVTRQLDWDKFQANTDAILAENLRLVSQNARPTIDGIHMDIWDLPTPSGRERLRGILQESFKERDDYVETKVGELEEQYLTLHDAWVRNCAKLDLLAEQRRVKDAEAAAAAAHNVVSEPVAAQTRSTRRNPVVNAGVMADAVHSDMEMEKVMNTMRDAAAVDPDLLARPNLAKIPDMISVIEPDMVRLTFDDENGQVDIPLEFYDFRGRAVEQWTPEERAIFIEHHRIHNKRFEKISEHLPHKTTSQCVQYYYLMKKVPSFRAQVKRGQRRRLGRGGHQGKASALMADIEKEEDGTTASPREDESIATRRPRRHAAAAALASTPPPNATPTESTRGRPRSRVAELARANSFGTERDGSATPASVASDSEAGGEGPDPLDLDAMLSSQVSRRGGPGRGRRWAIKGESANGNGASVRLDGAEPPKKRPATTSYWTVAERTTLKQNLLRHGRDWARIAAIIQTKTAIQAKNYYFNNQKEMSVFVKAWEREQAKSNGDSASYTTPEGRLEVGSSTTASSTKDKKANAAPVTIQPALSHQSTFAAAAPSSIPSGKAPSGRGHSHYPNVVTQASGSQQPQWAKNTFPTTKTKPQPNQPQVIPTPPLPLPGPTFRAWPVSAAPPAPPSRNLFGTFAVFPGPGAAKGNDILQATTPSVQRTGSVSASVTPSPVSHANPTLTATNTNRGTGGVQRANVNHYPGPMRYQPYPGPVGNNTLSRGKQQMPLHVPLANGMGKLAPVAGVATTAHAGGPMGKTPLPRTFVDKVTPTWTGDNVSK
ncbi:Myb-like DNA-binding domain protein [Rhizoctonia solani 123E]|uniref:Myb-like DNA-binding domain protein n=1 Tax=Rhizoctonia solani 123E TaxID=1423351 RepID=A0A074SYV7_9AGAM|nr:Myb-like DNA-binding domain protein [Rhizoctonia solani 123E]